jgi:hypothetical protein
LSGDQSHLAAEGILDDSGTHQLENRIPDLERVKAFDSLATVAPFGVEKELDRGQVHRRVLRLEDFLNAGAQVADASTAPLRSLGNARHGPGPSGVALLYVHAEAPWRLPRSARASNVILATLLDECIDSITAS